VKDSVSYLKELGDSFIPSLQENHGLPEGKSRPAVTESFLVTPHFYSNIKCSEMKVTLNVGLVVQDLQISRSVHPKKHLCIFIDADF